MALITGGAQGIGYGIAECVHRRLVARVVGPRLQLSVSLLRRTGTLQPSSATTWPCSISTRCAARGWQALRYVVCSRTVVPLTAVFDPSLSLSLSACQGKVAEAAAELTAAGLNAIGLSGDVCAEEACEAAVSAVVRRRHCCWALPPLR